MLAHLILAMPLRHPHLILRLHLIINHNIQIPPILVIRPTRQSPLYFLPSLHRQHIGKIKHRLLPVRVFRMRTGGEADGFVAGGELDVEPSDQGVDVVGAADGEGEGEAEVQIGGCAGVEVEGEHCGGVGDDGFEFDGIDEGFGEGSHLEGRIVEAVDAVPDC